MARVLIVEDEALTACATAQDVMAGIDAGANDHLTRPFAYGAALDAPGGAPG